jgi:hypothetical protein
MFDGGPMFSPNVLEVTFLPVREAYFVYDPAVPSSSTIDCLFLW